MEQLREMPRAILIAKRNVSEFWKKAHPTQPLFYGGFNFSVQYHRHALWLLLDFTSRLPIYRQAALVPQSLTVKIQRMFKTDHKSLFGCRWNKSGHSAQNAINP